LTTSATSYPIGFPASNDRSGGRRVPFTVSPALVPISGSSDRGATNALLSATQTPLPSLAVAHSGQEDLARLSAWPSQNLRELVSEARDAFWSAHRYERLACRWMDEYIQSSGERGSGS
jgi:hypothetical protein